MSILDKYEAPFLKMHKRFVVLCQFLNTCICKTSMIAYIAYPRNNVQRIQMSLKQLGYINLFFYNRTVTKWDFMFKLSSNMSTLLKI